MGRAVYAAVGSWFFRPGEKGVSLMRYDEETGSLELIGTWNRELNVDYLTADSERGIIYAVDTCATPAGGYIVSLRLDRDNETLELNDRRPTLFRDPDYIWRTDTHLFVTHHSDKVLVNRFEKGEDGSFRSRAEYDDVGMAAFRLDNDGGICGISDVALTTRTVEPGKEHVFSRQHSVNGSPDGKLLIVCDKGANCLYSYSFDKETGKFKKLFELGLGDGTAPRYGAFHKELPIFYCDCEKRPDVLGFCYDPDTGELKRILSVSVLENRDEEKCCRAEGPGRGDGGDAADGGRKLQKAGQSEGGGIEAGDIKLHPDGRYMYVTIRGLDEICVLRVLPDGGLKLVQHISCGGDNPRCLCFSPDGRYLLCGNLKSSMIATFAVGSDGRLTDTGLRAAVPVPSAIAFL